jgi:hypothetical protein
MRQMVLLRVGSSDPKQNASLSINAQLIVQPSDQDVSPCLFEPGRYLQSETGSRVGPGPFGIDEGVVPLGSISDLPIRIPEAAEVADICLHTR